MTGWKIVDSEREEYKAWHLAVEAWKDNPSLTFTEQKFDMAGYVKRDVTDEVMRRAGLDVDWLKWLESCDDIQIVPSIPDKWHVMISSGDARTGGGTYVALCDERWQAELIRNGLRALKMGGKWVEQSHRELRIARELSPEDQPLEASDE